MQEEREGLDTKFYSILWERYNEMDHQEFGVGLPHSLVYQNKHPIAWYFSNKQNQILKRREACLNNESILQHFTLKKISKSNVLGYFIENSEDKNISTRITYFNFDSLKKFLDNPDERPDSGVLQQFIDPVGDHNALYRATWSQGICVISKKQNKQSLFASHLDIYERCCTFDGYEIFSQDSTVAGGVLPVVINDCMNKMNLHIFAISDGNAQFKRADTFFKQDSTGKIWLLWNNSCRIQLKGSDMNMIGQKNSYHSKKQNMKPLLLELPIQIPVWVDSGATYDQRRPNQLQKDLKCQNCEQLRKHTEFAMISYKYLLELEEDMTLNNRMAAVNEQADKVGIPSLIQKLHPKMDNLLYNKIKNNPKFYSKEFWVCQECYLSLISSKIQESGTQTKARPNSTSSKGTMKPRQLRKELTVFQKECYRLFLDMNQNQQDIRKLCSKMTSVKNKQTEKRYCKEKQDNKYLQKSLQQTPKNNVISTSQLSFSIQQHQQQQQQQVKKSLTTQNHNKRAKSVEIKRREDTLESEYENILVQIWDQVDEKHKQLSSKEHINKDLNIQEQQQQQIQEEEIEANQLFANSSSQYPHSNSLKQIVQLNNNIQNKEDHTHSNSTLSLFTTNKQRRSFSSVVKSKKQQQLENNELKNNHCQSIKDQQAFQSFIRDPFSSRSRKSQDYSHQSTAHQSRSSSSLAFKSSKSKDSSSFAFNNLQNEQFHYEHFHKQQQQQQQQQQINKMNNILNNKEYSIITQEQFQQQLDLDSYILTRGSSDNNHNTNRNKQIAINNVHKNNLVTINKKNRGFNKNSNIQNDNSSNIRRNRQSIQEEEGEEAIEKKYQFLNKPYFLEKESRQHMSHQFLQRDKIPNAQNILNSPNSIQFSTHNNNSNNNSNRKKHYLLKNQMLLNSPTFSEQPIQNFNNNSIQYLKILTPLIPCKLNLDKNV